MRLDPVSEGSIEAAESTDKRVPLWVIADSWAALNYARASGLPEHLRIETAAPALLADRSISAKPIDGDIGAAGMSAVHEATLAMADDVYRIVRRTRFADIALSLARVAVAKQSVVYRASTLRSAHFEEPGVVAEIDAGSPSLNARFRSPLAELLSDQQNVEVTAAPSSAMPSSYSAAPPVAGFWPRFRHASIESVLFRALSKIWRWLPVPAPRGKIWILRENELLKEAAFWLGLAGYELRSVAAPQIEAAAPDGADWLELESEIGAAMTARLKGVVVAQCLPILCDWLLAAMREAAGQFRDSLDEWKKKLGSGKPVAVLSNLLITPSAAALFTACRESGVPFFGFQHGVTREICQRVASYDVFAENGAADYSVMFNNESARQEKSNRYGIGKPLVAGAPRDYYRTSDEGHWDGTAPPIWYVSACLPVGNTSLLNLGSPDHEKVTWERELLKLLNTLPHRVLYKPYPGARYIDPDPLVEEATQMQNVEVFQDRIDLRYIAKAARVILTARASGTFSWCYLPGKPVVFVNHPEQGPLREQVLPIFREAVFTFDAGAPNWHHALTDFLSQPIEAIEALWLAKAPARRRFIRDYMDAAEGKGAGRNAASLVRTAMREYQNLRRERP